MDRKTPLICALILVFAGLTTCLVTAARDLGERDAISAETARHKEVVINFRELTSHNTMEVLRQMSDEEIEAYLFNKSK